MSLRPPKLYDFNKDAVAYNSSSSKLSRVLKAGLPYPSGTYVPAKTSSEKRTTTCYTFEDEYDQESSDFVVRTSIVAHATEFVTHDLLGSQDTLAQMRIVHEVYQKFAPILAQFREKHGLGVDDVHLVYKGGNVMRFVMHGLVLGNPHLIERIHTTYLDHFKASDIDFGITVTRTRPSTITSNDVHLLTIECETAMQELRDAFIRSRGLISGLRHSSDVLRDALQRAFANMKDSIRTHNNMYAESPLPEAIYLRCMGMSVGDGAKYILQPSTARTDFAITLESANDSSRNTEHPPRVVCESNRLPQTLYVSRNEALRFQTKKGGYRHFNLVRMKLCFELAFVDGDTRRLGGEVVDLSITHTDSIDPTPFVFDRLSGGSTTIYETYKLRTPTKTYKLESYSVAGLACDTIRIVFEETDNPWDDKKYKKRIIRIMGLLLCEAFFEQGNGVSTETVVEAMQECVKLETRKLKANSLWAFMQKYVAIARSGPPSAELTEFVTLIEGLSLTNVAMLNTKKPTESLLYNHISLS